MATIDPSAIASAADIPPAGSLYQGATGQGLVDVYCGTVAGDIDAVPAAQELLATAADTGGLANADYVYSQLARLYGADLPALASPSGASVKCLVFVSGSANGGYGAFHFPGAQTDFDKIVVDSLTASGGYSPGGLAAAPQPAPAAAAAFAQPRLFQPQWAAAAFAAAAPGGRQYLSTALFAAEAIECFEQLTGKADAGHTDGEAVSRVLAFKLCPEIMLVAGFNGGVTQQWWQDGHPDWVNDNSQTDQSTDGNAAGVMFLLFLNDYLGVPIQTILAQMPASGGAPLGQTYAALLNVLPALAQTAGADGPAAFQAMITQLTQNAQAADGTLTLPADGNPFPSMPGAQQGGLFAA
ncbi:MAG TPA: hypothetical protein VKQ54_12190 [Caulobacteraceae bacterium]|nr:hypothetical protein [Caulobacteraceae bacterium]